MSSIPERNEMRRIMRFRESPPPASDLESTVRSLRDRELIKNRYRHYAFGVDSIDFELVRSVFRPECVVAGTLEEGALEDDLIRVGDDWKIIRRETAKQWHTGTFPWPTVGPPSDPRPKRPSRA